MDCPLCYHLQHELKIDSSNPFLTESKNQIAKDAMELSIRYYYSHHQQGKPPALKDVYNKFYNYWLEQTKGYTDKESIFSRKIEESGQNYRSKNNQYVMNGYERLNQFYRKNLEQKQAVLVVNHPYEIIMDDLIITGTFDLIREVPGAKKTERKVELVSFQYSNRKPDESKFAQNLHLTAMQFAFEQTFHTPPDRFVLQYINRGEEYEHKVGVEEYKRMLRIFDSFGQSVDKIPPYPRPGGHIRYSPYHELCNHYEFT